MKLTSSIPVPGRLLSNSVVEPGYSSIHAIDSCRPVANKLKHLRNKDEPMPSQQFRIHENSQRVFARFHEQAENETAHVAKNNCRWRVISKVPRS